MKSTKRYACLIILALSLLTCVLGLAATEIFRPRICDRPLINRFRDIDYDVVHEGLPGGPEPFLRSTNLGPVFDVVQANPTGCDPLPQKNVSNMFPVETLLYTVQGYKPAFRLAVRNGASIVLLQAVLNPHAKTGADLLDIEGKVQSIVVSQRVVTHGQSTPTPTSSIITDPKQIASLIRMILDAAVMNTSHTDFTGKSYGLEFYLSDDTILTCTYWPDAGEMQEGEEYMTLPQAFRVALEQALLK